MPLSTFWLALLANGCNHYEMFALAGYEQANFSNDADVLFVIDNSTSMWQESGAMGLNFNTFIDYLTNPNAGGFTTENLSDAVDNYVAFTTRRGAQVDYRLAITTSSVHPKSGPTSSIDPGEAGTLVGDPAIMSYEDPEVGAEFRRALLCEATCWNSTDLPSDDKYECGTETSEITRDYLNCPDVCDVGGWGYDQCGVGNEEQLEAALLALCRSVENPPELCFENVQDFALTQDDVLSNGDFIRDDSTVVVVIVTDEGDSSRRLAQAEEDPAEYVDAFAQFGVRIKFAVIGPMYEDGELICNSGGAVDWGVERLQAMASITGGFYNPIAVPETEGQISDCPVADFASHLQDLGDLLNSLLTSFKLKSIPDESTIRAFVDGKEVDKAELKEGTPGMSDAVYGDGWSYDPSENAVEFWGAAIPDYNQPVRIIYRPLEGQPRELPF